MILDEYVETKVSVGNYVYLKELGYNVLPFQKNKSQTIRVKVEHLKKGSNIMVKCKCDKCGTEYINRYSRNTDVCYPCRKVEQMLGNNIGSFNRGKPNLKQRGENHPRWNPNKTEYAKYLYAVKRYTIANHEAELKKLIGDKKLGICGGDVYQVDHKVSIMEGFYQNLPIEVIGHIDNLQVIPWRENNKKRANGYKPPEGMVEERTYTIHERGYKISRLPNGNIDFSFMLTKSGKICGRKVEWFRLQPEYLEISSIYPWCKSMTEILFCINNNILEPVICKICSSPTRFYNKKYKTYCSYECSNTDLAPSRLEKAKQTNLVRYGYENPAQSKEVQEKMQNTCLKRYGVSNYNKIKNLTRKKIS